MWTTSHTLKCPFCLAEPDRWCLPQTTANFSRQEIYINRYEFLSIHVFHCVAARKSQQVFGKSHTTHIVFLTYDLASYLLRKSETSNFPTRCLHEIYKDSLISVSNSGQNFKTRVSGSWEKIQENPFFWVLKWMRFWPIRTQYHCEITTVGLCAVY